MNAHLRFVLGVGVSQKKGHGEQPEGQYDRASSRFGCWFSKKKGDGEQPEGQYDRGSSRLLNSFSFLGFLF